MSVPLTKCTHHKNSPFFCIQCQSLCSRKDIFLTFIFEIVCILFFLRCITYIGKKRKKYCIWFAIELISISLSICSAIFCSKYCICITNYVRWENTKLCYPHIQMLVLYQHIKFYLLCAELLCKETIIIIFSLVTRPKPSDVFEEWELNREKQVVCKLQMFTYDFSSCSKTDFQVSFQLHHC